MQTLRVLVGFHVRKGRLEDVTGNFVVRVLRYFMSGFVCVHGQMNTAVLVPFDDGLCLFRELQTKSRSPQSKPCFALYVTQLWN